MSIALDIPPIMEQEVRHCANARGVTFSQFVFELVEREIARFRTEKAEREKRANATYEFLMAQDDDGLPKNWKTEKTRNPFEEAYGCLKGAFDGMSTDEVIREMRGC